MGIATLDIEHPKYKPMRWELQSKLAPDAPFVSVAQAPAQTGLFRAVQGFLRIGQFQIRELDDVPEDDRYIDINGADMPLANRARKARARAKVDG